MALALALPGCGLQPMYAGGGNGAVARSLSDVSISPIEGQSGWLVRNALADRLGKNPSATGTRYRLDIRLEDRVEGLGQLANDAITRERRTLRARYQLIDQQNGSVVLDATAGSDAGFDVVNSEYAVIAAEQTALENLSQEVADQIVTRVSIKLRKAK
jgi:LPS-assembly lipoprotein